MPNKPPTRTQEMRRQETSCAIIQATIDVIEALGYSNMRSKHISQRAGVTWGAVQHLFGSKEALLLAVVKHTHANISSQIDKIHMRKLSVEQRSKTIVDLTWKVYSSREYFALVEIVRGTKGDRDLHHKIVLAHKQLRSHIIGVWLDAFRDAPVTECQVKEACEHLTLTLSGLASRRRYLWPRADVKRNLDFAKAVSKLIICHPTLNENSGARGSSKVESAA